jgi:hypothetical protein
MTNKDVGILFEKEFPFMEINNFVSSFQEFHEDNDTPVLGLREGAILHREGDKLTLIGTTVGAVLFEKNQVPKQFQTNSDLTFLLKK